VPIITLILLSIILLIIYRTKVGRAMRCISHDMETTRLMGVDVNRVIAITFAMGSAAAAAGGILWALKYPQINPLMGIIPGLKAFVAAVLGGIGNVGGAMIGGLILGIAEIMLVAIRPDLSGYRDAIAFGILIIILLFRPTGLFGTKLPE
jgi:branched-chain amino acid transport system permease protein